VKLPSPIAGIFAAVLLLGVLGLARLLVVDVEVPDVEIREIDTVIFEEPPPPPPEDPPPDTPPPPPALTEVSEIPDPTRVPVPRADVPMDLKLPVEKFFTDVPPPPLPQPEVVDRRPPPAPEPVTPKPVPVRPAPPPPAPQKTHFNESELDGRPRILRYGSATFPPALARQGVSSGTVVLEVELSPAGAVSVRQVVSATHPDLVPAARRVAASARFTPPTRGGQPVRAIMRWPITIQK
jgi:periplasmic protein TonB